MTKHALPAVRRLAASRRLGKAALAAIDEEAVVLAYCKHLLNSMAIIHAVATEGARPALPPHASLLEGPTEPWSSGISWLRQVFSDFSGTAAQ